jgi:ADP-ribose pyrophosphatase YjhB (NUDIX family)
MRLSVKIEDSMENCEADVIEAAGGILWRETERGRELALIHRGRYDDWTLPKGKLEEGERWQEAAMREVREETGCDAELESFAGAVSYKVNGVAKVVLFWNMRSSGQCRFQPSEEVIEMIWAPLPEALEKMSHQIEKELLNVIR